MKRSLIALALVAALPFAASAQDAKSGLSYNYVQGGYVSTNTDAGDADGWALGGSVAVHPNVHLFGSYTSQNVDGVNADFDQWRVGAGYNKSLGLDHMPDAFGYLVHSEFPIIRKTAAFHAINF